MSNEAPISVTGSPEQSASNCVEPRRFRLVREVGTGAVEYIDYYGPFDGWGSDWSLQMRFAPARQRVAA